MSWVLGFRLILLQVGGLHLIVCPSVLSLVVWLDVGVSIIVRVVLSYLVLVLAFMLVQVVRVVSLLLDMLLLDVVVSLFLYLVLVEVVVRVRFLVLLALVESIGVTNSKFLQVTGWGIGLSLPVSLV